MKLDENEGLSASLGRKSRSGNGLSILVCAGLAVAVTTDAGERNRHYNNKNMSEYRIHRETFTESGARYGAYVFMAGVMFAWWPALAAGAVMLCMAGVASIISGK